MSAETDKVIAEITAIAHRVLGEPQLRSGLSPSERLVPATKENLEAILTEIGNVLWGTTGYRDKVCVSVTLEDQRKSYER
jgi:hypothetical protein